MNTATNATQSLSTKPWIVDSAECGWNGGLQVTGRNMNFPATNIGLKSNNFDFSGCVFGPQAKERLDSLLKLVSVL